MIGDRSFGQGWLALRKKGEAGSGVSLVFPLYDEHAVWGLDTDGARLLAALVAYAGAVGAPYYSSPGRTGTDLLQELGKRGAGRSGSTRSGCWPRRGRPRR